MTKSVMSELEIEQTHHRCFNCNNEFCCGAFTCDYESDGSITVFCKPECSKEYYAK